MVTEVRLLFSNENVSLLKGDVCHEGMRRVISRGEGTEGNFAEKRQERETQTVSSASEVPKQCLPGRAAGEVDGEVKFVLFPLCGGVTLPSVHSASH